MHNEIPPRPFLGFDIETEPNEEAARMLFKPWPPFDPASVKLGNVKDPLLRREKIEAAAATYATEAAQAEAAAIEKAALSALTGRVCAIGYVDQAGKTEIEDSSEVRLLVNFWSRFTQYGDAQTLFVFWSGSGASDSMFDLDFIFQRSLLLGVPVPAWVRPLGARFYAGRICDLASRFLLGKREAYLSLTNAARLFGLYGKAIKFVDAPDVYLKPKSDDDVVKGANFHKFLRSSDEADRDLARAYLRNDLHHLAALAPLLIP
jgi:hypothetical protein